MLIILWYNRIKEKEITTMNPFIYHELTEIAALLDESLKVMKEILKELKEVRDNEHQQE